MTELRKTDFMLEVAKSAIGGHSVLNKFGKYGSVADVTLTTIWDGAGVDVNYETVLPSGDPTSTFTAEVISTGNDNGAGSGANIITVQGVDGSGQEVSVDVTLATPAGTVANIGSSQAFFGIHRAFVKEAGTGNTNANNIIISTNGTGGGSGNVHAIITAGLGQTEMAVYFVPTNKTLYICNWSFEVDKASVAGNIVVAEVGLWTYSYNPASGHPVKKMVDHLGLVATNLQTERVYSPYKKIDGGNCVYMQSYVDFSTAGTTGEVHGRFNGYLVDD